eukprot:TRINITY_DN9089_c0_g1_i2.p1 TRINITY_DN9089_c0_g1~~TRINITY_DN9089_c0_g1_i2.p1  ORF type:complete len:502 (+),score=197.73 TRINITY_DN9089_c0_g1_i2:133-1638(+)
MEKINIKIKQIAGVTLEIQVDKEQTVFSLKKQIEEPTGVPAESQRLIFMGKVLNDSHTLSSTQLKEGSVIHLVLHSPAPNAAASSSNAQGTNNSTNESVQMGPQPPQQQNQPNHLNNPSLPQPIQQQTSFRISLNPQDLARMMQNQNANNQVVNNQQVPQPQSQPLGVGSPPQANPIQQQPQPIGQVGPDPMGILNQLMSGLMQQGLNVNGVQVSQQISQVPNAFPQQPGQQPQQMQQNQQQQPQVGVNRPPQPVVNAPTGIPMPQTGSMQIHIQQAQIPQNGQGINVGGLPPQPNRVIVQGFGQNGGVNPPQSVVMGQIHPPFQQNHVHPHPHVQQVVPNPLDSELDVAVIAGDYNRVVSLVERGANVNRGALHKALAIGRRDIVEYLISKGSQIELKIGNGETPLHTACFFGQTELVEWLIDNHHANMFERNGDGMTPLLLSVYNNHSNTLQMLLKKGANIHDHEAYGSTALIIASQKGYVECVNILLKEKALPFRQFL